METIHLTAPVTATDLDDVYGPDRKIETLDECFRRCRTETMRSQDGKTQYTMNHEGFHTARIGFQRATAYGTQRPHEGLKIVEIYAAWVQASLDAIEAHWSSEMDRLLAAFIPSDPANSTMTYEEWSKATAALEVSCGVKRTNVTKAAYGITYKEFAA
jgi:hypothetical protein